MCLLRGRASVSGCNYIKIRFKRRMNCSDDMVTNLLTCPPILKTPNSSKVSLVK